MPIASDDNYTFQGYDKNILVRWVLPIVFVESIKSSQRSNEWVSKNSNVTTRKSNKIWSSNTRQYWIVVNNKVDETTQVHCNISTEKPVGLQYNSPRWNLGLRIKQQSNFGGIFDQNDDKIIQCTTNYYLPEEI